MIIIALIYAYGLPLLQNVDPNAALNAEQSGKLLLCLVWLVLPLILLSEWRRRRRARRCRILI